VIGGHLFEQRFSVRNIQISFGPDPVDAASAISDVRLAVALLMGASTSAEAHIARTTGPTPEGLAAAGPLLKVIKACHAFEAAVAGPAHHSPSARMPSPATLATIASVEAARASMPSAATLATIAAVEATRRPKG
jgi:hypothetical protein